MQGTRLPIMESADRFIPPPWQGTGLTDIGLVRTSNQDAFAVENQLGLWVIADGMGGHAGGSIASDLAVKSVVEHVRALSESWSRSADQRTLAVTLLAGAVSAGDAAIRRQVESAPDLTGMGTTLVAALLFSSPHSHFAVAHVGDSRAYLIRSHTIRPLTTDHSFVQRLLTEGQITPEEAKTHAQQNILLRALGAQDQAAPDIAFHTLEPQDILLLCTDGLTKTVSEDEMLSIVSDNLTSSARACRQLIDLANAHGGKDNTTVVVISPHLRTT